MAKNKLSGRDPITTKAVVVSHPAVPLSGDPCRFGTRGAVALEDEQDDGKTTIDFGPASFLLSVQAINGSGSSAVAPGDELFYVDANTPPVSKVATGAKIGLANGAITGGATAVIEVLVGM
jgi:hypothetical protein